MNRGGGSIFRAWRYLSASHISAVVVDCPLEEYPHVGHERFPEVVWLEYENGTVKPTGPDKLAVLVWTAAWETGTNLTGPILLRQSRHPVRVVLRDGAWRDAA